ncbi:MAG: hypothetical protein ACF8Q5_13675 [Phycisphaerales bacterium JB040]
MNETELFVGMHARNARQGPGSEIETRLAIDPARLRRCGQLAVADFASGTGVSSLVFG